MSNELDVERLEAVEFNQKYREFQSIWERNTPPRNSNWDIYAILIWKAPVGLRRIAIEIKKDAAWRRFIIWWLGYCIIGECSPALTDKPELLYDDITFFLVHYYSYFGLPQMRWCER